jgi:hypothetical protein
MRVLPIALCLFGVLAFKTMLDSDTPSGHLQALQEAKDKVARLQTESANDPPPPAAVRAKIDAWARCMAKARQFQDAMTAAGGDDGVPEPGVFSSARTWSRFENTYGCGPGPTSTAGSRGGDEARRQLTEAVKDLQHAQAAVDQDKAKGAN